jgi:nicotinic acid phosphoribosyltransferase
MRIGAPGAITNRPSLTCFFVRIHSTGKAVYRELRHGPTRTLLREYTIFAGLDEVLRFAVHYKFGADEIEHLRQTYPEFGEEFLSYLASLDATTLKIYAVDEGRLFSTIPI